MANLTRRQWLKVGLAVGGMVTFGLSYRDVAKRAIDGLLDGTSGKITRDRIFANADVFDFELSEADMALIDTMDEQLRSASIPDDLL